MYNYLITMDILGFFCAALFGFLNFCLEAGAIMEIELNCTVTICWGVSSVGRIDSYSLR